MQDRSLGESGRRQFRGGSAVRLGMAFVVVALMSGCVAEAKHRKVMENLHIANKVNRDLENRMKIAAVELAEARGTQGMGEFGLKAVQAELDAVRVRNALLHDQNVLLEEQVRNIPALELPRDRDDGSGFREEEFSGFPGVRVERGDVILEGDVTFASGKTTLRPDAKRVLDRVAEVMTSRHNGQKIFISGHTDNTRIKKSKHLDNWDLAAKRAHAVFKYLESRGVADTDMILQSFGYADPAPGIDPNSIAGRARCRRVEIHLGSN